MKRVFIIHGWGALPEQAWRPWLKTELEKRGFAVKLLAMPNTETPIIADWVKAIADEVGKPDKQTFLVGHSLGCQSVVRYVEQLPVGSSLGGILLVAGFLKSISNITTPEQEAIIKPWRDTPIDFEKVKKTVGDIRAIFSEGDVWIPIENKKFIEERLGARTYIEDGKGERRHFGHRDNVTELPKALELVLEMSATPLISIDEFFKMEIKMGKILTAERIPGADKLYKLSIDLGEAQPRTICSGVAQFYQPEELVGKVVPVIANLAPRIMRGIESQGMILMADNVGPVLLTPIKDVPPGSIVK